MKKYFIFLLILIFSKECETKRRNNKNNSNPTPSSYKNDWTKKTVLPPPIRESKQQQKSKASQEQEQDLENLIKRDPNEFDFEKFLNTNQRIAEDSYVSERQALVMKIVKNSIMTPSYHSQADTCDKCDTKDTTIETNLVPDNIEKPEVNVNATEMENYKRSSNMTNERKQSGNVTRSKKGSYEKISSGYLADISPSSAERITTSKSRSKNRSRKTDKKNVKIDQNAIEKLSINESLKSTTDTATTLVVTDNNQNVAAETTPPTAAKQESEQIDETELQNMREIFSTLQKVLLYTSGVTFLTILLYSVYYVNLIRRIYAKKVSDFRRRRHDTTQ